MTKHAVGGQLPKGFLVAAPYVSTQFFEGVHTITALRTHAFFDLLKASRHLGERAFHRFRSSSVSRASISSSSIALAAWPRMLSAALTRVDAGEFGSSMIFNSVVAAALDPCCRRTIDCE